MSKTSTQRDKEEDKEDKGNCSAFQCLAFRVCLLGQNLQAVLHRSDISLQCLTD